MSSLAKPSVYNRGAGGFHAPGDRYLEMRAIAAHMAAKEFAKIPGESSSVTISSIPACELRIGMATGIAA